LIITPINIEAFILCFGEFTQFRSAGGPLEEGEKLAAQVKSFAVLLGAVTRRHGEFSEAPFESSGRALRKLRTCSAAE
jgi:hypothetical protein